MGTRTFVKVGRREDARHGMILAHLLEDLDEETNLDLGGLLQKSIQSSSPLCFAEHPEPLFNGTELVFEVLVERGCGHFFERGLVLINVGDPLLRNLVLCVALGVALVLTLLGLAVKVGGGSDAARRRSARDGSHVRRSPQVMPGTDSSSGGWAERGGRVGLGGAVAIPDDVTARHVERRPGKRGLSDLGVGWAELGTTLWSAMGFVAGKDETCLVERQRPGGRVQGLRLAQGPSTRFGTDWTDCRRTAVV